MSESTLNRAVAEAAAGPPEGTPPPPAPAEALEYLLGVLRANVQRAVVLAVGGIKGGIGKSTSSMMLALAWALLGLKVLVIDADPKSGSARKWARHARRRKQPLPFDVKAHPAEDLADRIVEEGWHKKYDLIIIDTGGDNDRILRAAYDVADHMLLTASPSPADVDSLPDTAATVAGDGGERDIPVTMLLIGVKSRPMEESVKEKMRALKVRVLNTTIKHSVNYQNAYGWRPASPLGYSVVREQLDLPRKDAA